MPRRAGGIRRKRRTHKIPAPAEGKFVPRSFVLQRGKIPVPIRTLIRDLRQMLMPHTAINIRERKSNNLRDYISIAGPLSISHFWLLSASSSAPYLRLATVPQGPTLTFRIAEYSLAQHVRAVQRRPHNLGTRDFDEPPLLVLNQMKGDGKHEKAVQLVAETFRHSFPPLDISTTRLSTMRRVLLVQRDSDTGRFYLRHYVLKVQPAGLSRPVRKLITKKRVPKLAKLSDVSQLMEGGGAGVFSSDSEMETAEFAKVKLPQQVRSLRRGSTSTVKLVEVGPRLTLELIKVVSGLCEGETLYHSLVEKTAEEVEETRRMVEERKELKRKRREEQEGNVRRKKERKRAKKERHKKNIEARLRAEKDAEARGHEEEGEESLEENETAGSYSDGPDADGELSD
eukprot:GFKZ01015787.1.p1 GENE.GFKZ01015787.1~~GFKZ01015787.1.p1  ORF type:complete len:399 (-),score=69.46 GFKZ01015787.1:1621-2817(-)